MEYPDYDTYWQAVKQKNDHKKYLRACRRKAKLLKKKQSKKKSKRIDNHILYKKHIKEYHQLKNSIINRANGLCELCGRENKYPIMHHIKPVSERPDLFLDFNNVLSICTICHAEIHPWLRK